VSLAVLLTNIVLAGRTGTEVVVEQLADGLRRRGHRPMVFTPQAGQLAEQLRARGHFVVSRPGALPFRPDIIHAHHTGPAMAALAAHPGVPAIFVSHDAAAPFDVPPAHPRLRRVFAVDERCRARLLEEGALPGRVALLPNAVDLSRIPPRPAPLPARPQRALAVTRQTMHLPALREACAAAGIALEEWGAGPGRVTARPEEAFASVDLVFATARTALEAAACGAGVVVCDARGCAGFLTRRRAKAWLPWNFGAAVLRDPTEPGPIAAAIAEWSPAEAAEAAALVRDERDLERMLDRLEGIYREVIAEPTVEDAAAEAAAVGAFIAGWVPSFDLKAPWRNAADAVSRPFEAVPAGDLVWQMSDLRGRVAELSGQVAAVLEGQRAAAEAATRGPARNAWAAMRAAWRRVVPLGIRAPIRRWRGRLGTQRD
jgi:glycosyltransferase involved in cell wall biosynthesis